VESFGTKQLPAARDVVAPVSDRNFRLWFDNLGHSEAIAETAPACKGNSQRGLRNVGNRRPPVA